MENPSQKEFLTRNIDHLELETCFYSDIEDGEYIVISTVKLMVYDVIIAPEKRRGWYDFYFLIYSEKTKKLMKLYPCYYTKRGMGENYVILKEDNHVVILEKEKQKENVRRPPAPKWRKALFLDYFERNHQFRHTNEYDNVELIKKRRDVSSE